MQYLTLEQIRSCRGHTVVIDTETTGLAWWRESIIGVGIHCEELGISGYLPTCTYGQVAYGTPTKKKMWLGRRDYSRSSIGSKVYEYVITRKTRLTAIPDEDLVEEAKAAVLYMANDPNTLLIGHNLKFDAHFLDLLLYELPCSIMDTTVLVHLYDSRLKKSLEKSEEYFLDTKSKRGYVELGKGEGKLLPWNWSLENLAAYCSNDCVVTYQLFELLMPQMEKLKLKSLLSLQMKFLRVLQKMERRGMLLDYRYMKESRKLLEDHLAHLERDLFDACGKEFNWKSGAQLSKALYQDMGIPMPENPFAESDGVDRSRMAHVNRYNKYRTSSFILMEKGAHPLGPLVLEMRECAKLVDFLDNYKELADDDHIMHGTFNITGTRTGRLSASRPNLQNIPSSHRARANTGVFSGGGTRTGEYNLRQSIIAKPGYKLVSIDHRQQEMRMFGILAQEPVMMEALKNREDIHMRVALSVWGDCGDELNELHREWSKAIGFGLIYGMTTGSLQYRLNKTSEEAQNIAQQYWNTFPRIQPWLNEVIKKGTRQGYIRYWDGRIWRENDPMKVYKGANAQIQGGAAGIMSLAIVRADKIVTFQDWGGVLSIIHDEAIFEIREDCLDIAVPVLLRVMEVEDIFNLPFHAEAKVGDSYGTLQKLPIEIDVASIDWKAYNTEKQSRILEVA
jgi:DNA polymerase-1